MGNDKNDARIEEARFLAIARKADLLYRRACEVQGATAGMVSYVGRLTAGADKEDFLSTPDDLHGELMTLTAVSDGLRQRVAAKLLHASAIEAVRRGELEAAGQDVKHDPSVAHVLDAAEMALRGELQILEAYDDSEAILQKTRAYLGLAWLAGTLRPARDAAPWLSLAKKACQPLVESGDERALLLTVEVLLHWSSATPYANAARKLDLSKMAMALLGDPDEDADPRTLNAMVRARQHELLAYLALHDSEHVYDSVSYLQMYSVFLALAPSRFFGWSHRLADAESQVYIAAVFAQAKNWIEAKRCFALGVVATDEDFRGYAANMVRPDISLMPVVGRCMEALEQAGSAEAMQWLFEQARLLHRRCRLEMLDGSDTYPTNHAEYEVLDHGIEAQLTGMRERIDRMRDIW